MLYAVNKTFQANKFKDATLIKKKYHANIILNVMPAIKMDIFHIYISTSCLDLKSEYSNMHFCERNNMSAGIQFFTIGTYYISIGIQFFTIGTYYISTGTQFFTIGIYYISTGIQYTSAGIYPVRCFSFETWNKQLKILQQYKSDASTLY